MHPLPVFVGVRVALFSILVIALTQAAGASSARLLTLEERVQRAEDIVVANVIDADARWSEGTPRYIQTTFTLMIEQTILGSAGAGEIVTITVWGGTIGRETQGIAGVRVPQRDRRYLFMLGREWRTAKSNPIVAADQGVFEIVADDRTGGGRIVDFKGQTLAFTTPGQPSGTDVSPMSLSDLAIWIQAVARGVASTPVVTANGLTLSAMARDASDVPDQNEFTYFCRVRSSVIWNQYTYTNAWYLVDVRELSKWNFYSQAFVIFQDPIDDRYWHNGRSETFNLMNDQQRQAVFGAGPWGAGELAATFYRCIDGFLVESDIVFNASVNWTFDDEMVYNGTAPPNTWPLRQAMLHEFGHAVGLDHDFNELSVMNYAPRVFRAYALPFMRDADGIRFTASGATIPTRTDVGVYLFRSSGYQSWTNALFRPVVVAGESFSISNFHVENAGTTTVVNPALKWYLTKDRAYSTTGFFSYLGRTQFNTSLPRSTALPAAQASVTVQVPYNLDGGSYFLSALVDVAGNTAPSQSTFPFSHQAGFSRERIRVYPNPGGMDAPFLVGGQTGEATLYLGGRTDELGMTLYLRSSLPNVVSVPISITVPPGVTQVSFPVTSQPVASVQDVTITAGVLAVETFGLTRVFPLGITVTAPVSGARWVVGTQKTIRWTHGLGAGSVVFVDLSRDGGGTYTVVGNATNAATTGELVFSVPGPASTNARLRVRFGNVSVVEVPFTIATSSPTASNDAFSTGEGTALFVPAPGVLANDEPDDGGVMTAQQVSGVSHGTLTLAANGAFTYIPASNFRGTDTFSYRFTTALGTSSTATATVRVGAAVNRNDLALDFGATGLWMRHNSGSLARLHTANAGALATGDLDGNGQADLIVDFPGSGVWVWSNNTTWVQLHTVNAAAITTGDLDGNGLDEVLLDFPGFGIWVRANNSGWFQLYAESARHMVTADLDGNGKAEAIIDCQGFGVWVWNNNTFWSQLHSANAAAIVAGDFDGSGRTDLLIDFPGSGLWVWSNNTAWFRLHAADATVMTTADVDGNGKADAIISFPGSGIWAWMNGASFVQLHASNAALMTAADIDSNGRDDLIISFPGVGVWAWMNHASWQPLHTQNPEGMTAGNLGGS